MSKHGKKFEAASKQVEQRPYTLHDAVPLVQKDPVLSDAGDDPGGGLRAASLCVAALIGAVTVMERSHER